MYDFLQFYIRIQHSPSGTLIEDFAVFTTALSNSEKDNGPRPKYFIITIKKNQIQHSYLQRYMLCDNY
jgi:hypothetical protein